MQVLWHLQEPLLLQVILFYIYIILIFYSKLCDCQRIYILYTHLFIYQAASFFRDELYTLLKSWAPHMVWNLHHSYSLTKDVDWMGYQMWPFCILKTRNSICWCQQKFKSDVISYVLLSRKLAGITVEFIPSLDTNIWHAHYFFLWSVVCRF